MSHFIPEPRNFAEVAILPAYIKKYFLKATLKDIKNVINNKTFIMYNPGQGEPVTPCMYVYKVKIQYVGSLDKLKLRVVVGGNFQNK